MNTYQHHGERETALAILTDTDVLLAFREALVRLYPVLTRFHCLQDDTQPYDDFDAVAETLWEILVVRTLVWRDGVSGSVQLPAYGFYSSEAMLSGYIQVQPPSVSPIRFVEFIGNRQFGPEPFNAVGGVAPSGAFVRCPLSAEILFSWVR